MSSPRPETPTARRLPPIDRWTWAALGCIVAIAALLRCLRLAEAPSGYLVFNETFYLNSGAANAQRGFFSWFVNPIELNKPPLYQGLIATILRLGLPEVAGVRLLSVVAGLATVVCVFFLGRLLFDKRTGLIAAAMLATMPGVVLVDHNIQTDPLMISLTLWAVYLYVLAAATGRRDSALTGGAILGLAILTKQPAVLALPALGMWESWRTRGLSWIREPRVRLFALTGLLIGSSWYALQLALRPAAWFEQMFGPGALGREAMTGLGRVYWLSTAQEIAWMLFPAAALLACVGLAVASWQRKAGDKFIIVFTVTYFAFHMAVHLHSYYLLPVTPFLALAIGRVFTARWRPDVGLRMLRGVLVGALVLAMILASVVMLSAKKWGYWSPVAYAREPDSGYSKARIFYAPDLAEFFGPGVARIQHGQSEPASVLQFLDTPASPGVQRLFLARGVENSRAGGTLVPPLESVREKWIRPVVFGYAIGQVRLADADSRLNLTQVFLNKSWTAEKVGPLWRFGTYSVPAESSVFIYDASSFPL